MASMSELRAYKESSRKLSERLTELRKLESMAMVAWQESQGSTNSGSFFDQWTKAITRANDTHSALAFTDNIIREIEGQ